MTLEAAVLSALLALTPHWSDAPTTERPERLRLLAQAIAEATNDPDTAAALVAIVKHESNVAAYTWTCAVIPRGAADCDKGRARSPFQLHRAGCLEGWRSGSIMDYAKCAARHWRGGKGRCERYAKDAMAARFRAYRGPCAPLADEYRRVKTYLRIREDIRRRIT